LLACPIQGIIKGNLRKKSQGMIKGIIAWEEFYQ
jgi:hypothetical protein